MIYHVIRYLFLLSSNDITKKIVNHFDIDNFTIVFICTIISHEMQSYTIEIVTLSKCSTLASTIFITFFFIFTFF